MMNFPLLLALPAVLCASSPDATRFELREDGESAGAVVDDSLAVLYRTGQHWDAFYQSVDRRRELWIRNWTQARVPPHLADRAQQVGGEWKVLVITEPGCSDSANSIPYIAKLVEETPGLEMRLTDSTAGRPWMEAHRSADGRAATPAVLVLDEQFEIRGCWIEQPVALQAIWLPIVARGTMSEELETKMTWYAEDAGRETLREFVEVLEGAKSGNVVCPGM